MVKNLLVLATLMLIPILSNGQQGTVTGKIIDGEFNDVLPFANIVVKGNQGTGVTSDFDGVYSLTLDPGTYTIVYSFVGYNAKEVTGVEVKADTTIELNVTLEMASTALEEVVVTTTVRKNTEAALLNFQQKSAVMLDGLSVEGIKQTGASSIATAIRTVPGVSVQDGKFVYVRGLGDRYTKSILNGMDIPGLDPDKNTVQMDIFPTSILENIIVVKSASADLPADFTGGVVNIVTKDFPSQKTSTLNFSLGYNPDMNFKNNFLTSEGGSTDFLGFDDGTRKIPVNPNASIPAPPIDNGTLEGITRSFTPNMAAEEKTSLPNFNIGYSYGNQYTLESGNKLGFIASIDYKNNTKFYDNFQNGIFIKWSETDNYQLRADRTRYGATGTNTVLLSGLAGLSYKTEKSKYRLNLLHIQNGENNAAVYTQDTDVSNNLSTYNNYIEYKQKSVTNLLVTGKHASESGSFTTEWSFSPTLSSVKDKDAKLTTFIINSDGSYSISSDAGFPVRLWRELNEINLIGKLDFTKSYTLFENKSQLKFGGLYSYKNRDYAIYNYIVSFRDINTSIFNGDPDQILADQNVWTPETNSGSYIRGNFQPANNFEANQNTAAAYVSNEFKFSEKIKAIVGLRAEYFSTFFTGENNSGTLKYNNENTLDVLDLFPSANFIYSATEKSNVRLSYYRTTARPSFKEKSLVQISDLLTGLLFLGNIDLKPSYTHNVDVRYELFGTNAQMIAVSGFYKGFTDPIEVVAYDQTVPDQITPRNSDAATVMGVELEARKNFGFITESLEDFSLNLNLSLIDSKIDMAQEEYEARQLFARDGEEVKDNRALQGQSPYLINAGLTYNNKDIGLKTGFYYNVQGKTLQVVGSAGQIPDVYTMPFHSLNFNFSKELGEEGNSKVTFKVENLLGEDKRSQYESYNATNQNFSFRSPGTSFSIGYSINL